MIVRRERLHKTGSSNLPINERFCHLNSSLPESSAENHRASRANLLHVSHAKSQEAIKRKPSLANGSPIEEAKKYYEAQGKSQMLKTLIGYPRTACLEEKEKRKPAFVGDSQLYNKIFLLNSRSKSSDVIDKDIPNQTQSISNIRITKRKSEVKLSNKSLVAPQQQNESLINIQDPENKYNVQKVKHQNQLTLLLKNRITELNRNLHESDEGNTGYLTPFLFEQAILKLRIHETALSKNDIKGLYDEHKITPAKLDYKYFIKHLEDFKFPYDQSYNSLENTKLGTADQSNSHGKFEQSCKKFNVTDCRDLAYNTMINYFKKSRKVGEALKRFLPTKSDLNDYLVHTLKISKEEVEKKNITQMDFKDIVDGFLDKFKLDHLTQHEFEGFFSSVLFNRNGFTNFEEISKTIYDEKENDFLLKIQMKKKGPAPYNEKLFESYQIDNGNKLPDKNSASLKQLPFPSRKSSRSSVSIPTRDIAKQKHLESILKEIDHKVFMGRKSALKAFREFDMDKDGYVSRQDIIQKIQTSRIINNESIPGLIEYLDPDQTGYLDFQSFSHKIRPNMINDDAKGYSLGRTVSMIEKPDFEGDLKIAEKTKNVIKSLRNALDPANENQLKMKGKTKSSANPCWNNTFLNFQPNSGTSMFITERERLNRRPSARTRYQIEDKTKNIYIQERKLETIRRHQSLIKTRIEDHTSLLEQKDQNNLEKRLLNQTAYENSTRKGNSIF